MLIATPMIIVKSWKQLNALQWESDLINIYTMEYHTTVKTSESQQHTHKV